MANLPPADNESSLPITRPHDKWLAEARAKVRAMLDELFPAEIDIDAIMREWRRQETGGDRDRP